MTIGEGAAIMAVLLALPVFHRYESGAPIKPVVGAWPDYAFLLVFVTLLLFFLALIGTPILALGLAVAPILILAICNRVKKGVLREPLVFADVSMLKELILYPSFYFPYIPIVPFLVVCAITAAILVALLSIGFHPYDVRWQGQLLYGLTVLAILAACYFSLVSPDAKERWQAFFKKHPLHFDPELDGKTHGLVGAALFHAVWQYLFGDTVVKAASPDTEGLAEVTAWPDPPPKDRLPVRLPHVVLVQAESYFHMRRLDAAIGVDWTANFDRLAGEGQSGLLHVDGYGAYTVRSEFAILTGMEAETLKTYKFDPYSLATRYQVGSLPRWFADLGCETTCLHPNCPEFMHRKTVMPDLGFQRFLSLKDFEGAERIGPYVADAAIADRIEQELRNADTAKFLFAITIEAHGPWLPKRLEKIPWPQDASPLPDWLMTSGPDGGMAAYARHLRNADQFLGRIADLAPKLDRPLIVCFYGDHLGSLTVDAQFNHGSAEETNFLIWNSANRRHSAAPELIHNEQLGGMLLAELGRMP